MKIEEPAVDQSVFSSVASYLLKGGSLQERKLPTSWDLTPGMLDNWRMEAAKRLLALNIDPETWSDRLAQGYKSFAPKGTDPFLPISCGITKSEVRWSTTHGKANTPDLWKPTTLFTDLVQEAAVKDSNSWPQYTGIPFVYLADKKNPDINAINWAAIDMLGALAECRTGHPQTMLDFEHFNVVVDNRKNGDNKKTTREYVGARRSISAALLLEFMAQTTFFDIKTLKERGGSGIKGQRDQVTYAPLPINALFKILAVDPFCNYSTMNKKVIYSTDSSGGANINPTYERVKELVHEEIKAEQAIRVQKLASIAKRYLELIRPQVSSVLAPAIPYILETIIMFGITNGPSNPPQQTSMQVWK
jgi:hypothetical protein